MLNATSPARQTRKIFTFEDVRMWQLLLIALYNFNVGILLHIFVLIAYWYFTIILFDNLYNTLQMCPSVLIHGYGQWPKHIGELYIYGNQYSLLVIKVFSTEAAFFLVNNRSHDHTTACSDVYTGRLVILGITVVILIASAPGVGV